MPPYEIGIKPNTIHNSLRKGKRRAALVRAARRSKLRQTQYGRHSYCGAAWPGIEGGGIVWVGGVFVVGDPVRGLRDLGCG
jgi:hypothetical protein